MNFLLEPLNLVTFFPLLGIIVILFINREQKNTIRWVALITSLITFGISIWVLTLFNKNDPDLQLVINVGMVIGLLPVVGIPLVMFSYGGSSMITTMSGMGLLMNISMRRFMFQ